MSTPPTMDVDASIAGEPAPNQTHKKVPKLSSNPIRHQQKNQPQPKKNFFLTFAQTVLLVSALLLSTYSYVQLDSMSSQKGNAGEDAAEMLVRTEGRAADSICTEGGAEIYLGSDLNSNGYLDEGEVTSSTKVCHGKEGLSGPQGAPGQTNQSPSSLLSIEQLNVGNLNCPNGGIMIHSGIDLNENNELDQSEIVSIETLCDGSIGSNGINGQNGMNGESGNEGASALVEQRQPSAAVCPNGLILHFGVDDGSGDGIAFDSVLQEDEVRSSIQICSTPLLYGPISDMFQNAGDGMTTNCDATVWMVEQQRLLTAGANGIDGCELWVSEGTESSTQLLHDIHPSGDSLPGLYLGMTSVQTAHGERVFFDADDGINGRQLWVSDSTVIGTMRVDDSGNGVSIISSSQAVVWAQGVVVSSGEDNLLWSDGEVINNVFTHSSFSSFQQQELATSTQGITTFATEMLHANSTHVWFSAKSQDGIEPHLLTTDALFQSWNLNTAGDSQPDAPTILESGIVLVAEGQNGRQLVRLFENGSQDWLTSLQHQGTGNPTTHVGQHLGIHQMNGILVFDAITSGVDTQVWAHNISTGTTQILSATIVAPGDWAGGIVHQQRIWFDCVAPGVAHEICSSDGTVAGTQVETDLRAGMASSNILSFETYGEHLFFLASGQIDGVESGSSLWHIQNEEPASLVYDPWPGANNNSASGTYGELMLTEHHLIFVSHDGTRGHELHAWSHGEHTGDWVIWP